MEYVRGETLAEKIARRAPLTTGEKLKLMTELCAGLAHAHEAGLIHRDIKPANLMVDHHGKLKLLDFGIARGEAGNTRFAQITQVNVRIGTPGHMSPEQIEGAEIDARSDLFAVGAVLYELIAHSEAFSGSTTRQIENKVLQSQPAPLSSLVPGLDPELESIVNKALAKNPADRYQDATQFESALEHVRWRLGLAGSTPGGRATPAPVNVGRKSHESRAETAYLRGLAFFEEGAREAAKRYCIEALAEGPDHAAARALLHEIDPSAWVNSESAPPSTPVPPISVAPSGLRSAGSEERTMLSPHAAGWEAYSHEPTMIGTHGPSGSSLDNAPTAFGTQARRGTAPGADRTVVAALARSPWRIPPQWQKYVPVAAVTALVAVTASIAVLIAWWAFSPGTTDMTLTVTKPTHGTISTQGIHCGTSASDCTTTLQKGASVEFQVEADKGFRFSGFTGDCAPGGHTVMNSPRTCGATFEEDVVVSNTGEGVELLAIAPPTGGTVVAEGITCGSQGTECSTNRPRGSQLTLLAWADRGFTFQGFTGDCTHGGKVLMTAPRTCGAIFASALQRQSKAPPTTRANVGVPIPTPPGATGRQIALSQNISVPAPPAPPTLEEREAQARRKIEQVLDRVRLAYEALSFARLQSVYPDAPAAIKQQFDRYTSMRFTSVGTPRYAALNVDDGTATVESSMESNYARRVGGGGMLKIEAEIRLRKDGTSDDWTIASLAFRPRP
jgi:serine/threonine protein kinase